MSKARTKNEGTKETSSFTASSFSLPFIHRLLQTFISSNIPGIIQRAFFTTLYTNRSQCHPSHPSGREISIVEYPIHPLTDKNSRSRASEDEGTTRRIAFVRLYRPRNPILSSFSFSLSFSLFSPLLSADRVYIRARASFRRGLVSESYHLQWGRK